MNISLINTFRHNVEEIFAFLVAEHGFQGPLFDYDPKTFHATMQYVGKNIAIQCLLDVRDMDVSCKVAKMVNGTVTQDYAVNSQGQRVRDDIYCLFRDRGIRAKLFRGGGGCADFCEGMPITLEDYAIMLTKYGQDILEDSPHVFDGINRNQ